MAKRLLFGFLWFVLFYLAGTFVVGAVGGGIAGAKNPANASQAGAVAGVQAVEDLRTYIFLGAVFLSVLGTSAAFLPGTRLTRSSKPGTI